MSNMTRSDRARVSWAEQYKREWEIHFAWSFVVILALSAGMLLGSSGDKGSGHSNTWDLMESASVSESCRRQLERAATDLRDDIEARDEAIDRSMRPFQSDIR